jgi:hypothetical protein
VAPQEAAESVASWWDGWDWSGDADLHGTGWSAGAAGPLAGGRAHGKKRKKHGRRMAKQATLRGNLIRGLEVR